MSAIKEMRLSVERGLSVKCFHAGMSLYLRSQSADIHFVLGLNHTNCTIFAEHLDVAELPGPSIVVSISTTGL